MSQSENNSFARPRLGTRDGGLTGNNIQLPPLRQITTGTGQGFSQISPRAPEGQFQARAIKDTVDPFKPTVRSITPGYYVPGRAKSFAGGPVMEPALPTNKIMPAPNSSYYEHQPYQSQYHYYPSPPTVLAQPPIGHSSPQAVYYPQYVQHNQPIASNQFMGPEVINKTNNVCQRCGTTETPEWRRGPGGVKTLCNACGLFHAKLVKKKGAALAAEEVLNNKVCKGKNGRRISIKKQTINNDYLKSGVLHSMINTKNNNTNHVGELPPPVTPNLIHH